KNYTDRFQHNNPFHKKEFYKEEFTQFVKEHFLHSDFFNQGFEVVSVISNEIAEQAASIRLIHWQPTKTVSRKYTIAIASNAPLPTNHTQIASIVPRTNKDYLVLMDTMLDRQREIEKLGQWGKTLSETLALREQAMTTINTQEFLPALPSSHSHDSSDKNDVSVQSLQQRLQEQASIARQLQEALDQQKLIAKELNEQLHEQQSATANLTAKIQERELLTASVNAKLHLLYQEADKVKERLSEIYDSDGWRLLSRYYRLKGKLLPEDSRRYKQLKRLFQQLRGKAKGSDTSLTHSPLSALNAMVIVPFSIPSFEFPVVSIIIPAYNAWKMNYQCIAAIVRNSFGVPYEIILADDSSADETSTASTVISNLVHIRSQENLGFLKNCNHAAGFAKGKYLLFLNNDTTVHANWLAPMVTLAESDPQIGMVGGKLVYPDGRLQEAGGIIWNDASGWNYGHGKDPQLPEFNYVKEADYISGACILIKKEAWEKGGGFDERYTPAYCEDSDFAFTLRSIGYKVMYQPLTEVTHYEGYSHGTDALPGTDGSNIKSYQRLNNQKFFEKWKDVLVRDQFPNAVDVFHARDRSRGKKTLLMIDHYVPHFDKDAGSKTTFQYLQLFASMNLNVKFLGDNFFKHEPYTTAIQQLGVEVLYGPWYRNHWKKWLIDHKEEIDYVYLNRPHISIKYIDFIRKATNAKILYYGHDLHFLREQKQYEITKNPALLKSAVKWKQTESYLFDKSDIVLTPSDDEKEVIAALNSNYHVETILPYFFTVPASPITDFTLREDVLFVGGFNHQPNLDAVEWFCTSVWPAIHEQLPGAKFIVVGSNPPPAIIKLESEHVQIRGFVSDEELQAIYAQVKMVVIPLRFGAGVKGKTVEALYQGLPIITTTFGVEGMPGDTSFMHPMNEANTFADELVRIYKDDQLLVKMSTEGTQYINTHFTKEAAAAKMAALLAKA
ncbi:MAG TPA: glycosyltransferase, partial [Chitinophagaceae bacterium]|nr:glycosyltransferase [Chitinophagaceae bacterium]